MFDYDRDGKITMKELYQGLVERYSVDITDAEFATLARALDRDRSGDVSLDEFERVLRQDS